MADINNIVIVGRLTSDAKATPVGEKVAYTFTIANNGWSRKNQAQSAHFFTCKFFGTSNIGEYLLKGTQVCLAGSLAYEAWEDSAGQKHSAVRIIANNVQLLRSDTKSTTQEEYPF